MTPTGDLPPPRHGHLCLALLGFYWLAMFGYRGWQIAAPAHCPSWLYFALALALTAGVVALGLCMARLAAPARSNLTLTLASATVCVALAELALAAIGPGVLGQGGDNAEEARRAGLPYDSRSMLEVVLDFRADGKEAFPTLALEPCLEEAPERGSVVVRSLLSLDGKEVMPLGNAADRLCIIDNENGYYPTYTSDEHGFRNPAGLWSAASADIVALGDSFTEGFSVRDEDAFVARVRQEYPKTANLGLGGGGPLTMLACLREYGSRLRPKVVLWCFFEGNDLTDLRLRLRSPLLMSYLQPEFRQGLFERQDRLDAAILTFIQSEFEKEKTRAEAALASRSRNRERVWRACLGFARLDHLWAASKMAGKRILGRGANRPLSGAAWARLAMPLDGGVQESFRKALELALEEVQGWGGKLYFVYLPDWSRCGDPNFARSATSGEQDPRQQILAMLDELGIALIDATPCFASHPDPLALFPFRRFGHYNPAGHALVAETIIDGLRQDPACPLGSPEPEQHPAAP